MEDAADHPPIVNPMRSSPTSRQQRFDPRPFRIAQPVKLPCHPSLHRLEA